VKRPGRTPNGGANDQGRRARKLFSERGLHAKRSFGQCFLADANIARIIAAEATSPQGGTVVEIGAGTGALTAPLIARAARVVAIERDRDLAPVLRSTFADAIGSGALQVVEDDALVADWQALLSGGPRPHVLAGNLPYQLTGRILHRVRSIAYAIDRAVFMVQKELADRLVAAAGTSDYGALTVFVRSRFQVCKRIAVPSSCFRPRPKVDSTVVVMTPSAGCGQPDPPPFDAVVRAAFATRRKTLRNAWRGVCGLDDLALQNVATDAGVELEARGESLSLEQFRDVANRIARRGRGNDV
jgi:16S rRNA (adenine1518-N6/adenine1519-N6)-dimethyltransferase